MADKTSNEITYEKGLSGAPLKFQSVEWLEEQIEEYFESDDAMMQAVKDGEVINIAAPTMSGLALYLGMDRKTLYNYGKKAQFFPTIKKAKARVESHLEKRLYGNNVTGTIFNLKNNFDWADKTEVQQTNVDLTHEQWLDQLDEC